MKAGVYWRLTEVITDIVGCTFVKTYLCLQICKQTYFTYKQFILYGQAWIYGNRIVCSNRNTEFLKRKLPGNFMGGKVPPFNFTKAPNLLEIAFQAFSGLGCTQVTSYIWYEWLYNFRSLVSYFFFSLKKERKGKGAHSFSCINVLLAGGGFLYRALTNIIIVVMSVMYHTSDLSAIFGLMTYLDLNITCIPWFTQMG